MFHVASQAATFSKIFDKKGNKKGRFQVYLTVINLIGFSYERT